MYFYPSTSLLNTFSGRSLPLTTSLSGSKSSNNFIGDKDPGSYPKYFLTGVNFTSRNEQLNKPAQENKGSSGIYSGYSKFG